MKCKDLLVYFKFKGPYKIILEKGTFKFNIEGYEDKKGIYVFILDEEFPRFKGKTDILYIGKTENTFKSRFSGYKNPSKDQRTNRKLYRYFKQLLEEKKDIYVLLLSYEDIKKVILENLDEHEEILNQQLEEFKKDKFNKSDLKNLQSLSNIVKSFLKIKKEFLKGKKEDDKDVLENNFKEVKRRLKSFTDKNTDEDIKKNAEEILRNLEENIKEDDEIKALIRYFENYLLEEFRTHHWELPPFNSQSGG